jgi:hypothetical protein
MNNMRFIFLFIMLLTIKSQVTAQTTKIGLYDLIKNFMYDSTGYENVGDWAVDNPKQYPVKWKDDGIIMSEDTSINFYRRGNATIILTNDLGSTPLQWQLMLKGARSGYSSFSMLSQPSEKYNNQVTLDSLFGNKKYKARLIKACDNKVSGYNYYEVNIPKKDPEFLKVSWVSLNGKTVLRIDGYDNWSKYAVKLTCR